jgi:S-adenosylmethionine hydrolase
VILKYHSVFFVAPDNGVLSYLLFDKQQIVTSQSHSLESLKLKPGLKAVVLSNDHLWRPSVSATFHGRDILAPVAAHLSNGISIEEFGTPVAELMALPIPHPHRLQDKLIGHIMHIDNFGNLISDIHGADLPSGDFCIEVAGQCIDGLVQYYAQKDGLVALISSSDHLEIALSHGSAAAFTGASLGDEIIVKLRTHV